MEVRLAAVGLVPYAYFSLAAARWCDRVCFPLRPDAFGFSFLLAKAQGGQAGWRSALRRRGWCPTFIFRSQR